ncbi:MAG TPA: MmcQ/YjbR family DNA-binding protein [Pyrinomonadaceae bacterium]|jgi:hypothetical protein|nr:MmcQ/YjbR family DNA-binding protein [Pyrinomonadaceae bacterium]
MKKNSLITFDTVRRVGLVLPGVAESTSYGTPALKVKGKLMVRMWEDGETMVLKTTFEEREELMAADPETYFITDHYLNYEYVLVNLSKVSEDALSDLLRGAHRLAQAKPKK